MVKQGAKGTQMTNYSKCTPKMCSTLRQFYGPHLDASRAKTWGGCHQLYLRNGQDQLPGDAMLVLIRLEDVTT